MTNGTEIVGKETIGRDPRTMRLDEIEALGHKRMSPLKAIRLRCLDCCNEQPSEVRKCTAVTCPLWPFRMSKNPWYGSGSDDDVSGAESDDFSVDNLDAAPTLAE